MDFEEIFDTPELIGEGGFGKVYKVKSKEDGTIYALKVMENRAVWEKEYDILQNADHPLFPEFVDAGEEDGQFYILMEYIWGQNLAQMLKRRKGLAQQEAMRMALSIADGIGWLQTKEKPVIFRDLKADNIVVTPTGDVRLVDFGSACGLYDCDGIITGTEGQTAPEQMQGKAYLSSDVYAFGKLFHYMLTGDLKAYTDSEAQLESILIYDRSLSNCLELLIEDCIFKDSNLRLPDMYCVTQRMVEIATASEKEYKRMEKEAAKEIKARCGQARVSYDKNIRQ